MITSNGHLDRLKILLEQSKDRYNFVRSNDDAIETKAVAVFGFSSVVISIILQAEMINPINSFVLALLITSILLSIYIFWPKRYSQGSISYEDFPDYDDMDSEEMTRHIIADVENATTNNIKLQKDKLLIFKTTIVLTSSAIIVIDSTYCKRWQK